MRMVHISRKPIGAESNIVLLVSVNTIEQMSSSDDKKAMTEQVKMEVEDEEILVTKN